MIKLRSVNTGVWDDSFFSELDVEGKLLFLYFLTNALTTIAGVYQISKKRILFDTGLDRAVLDKHLQQFESAARIRYQDDWLVLRNWLKHQRLNTNQLIAVEKQISAAPGWVRETLSESFPNGSQASGTVQTTVANKGREEEIEKEVEAARSTSMECSDHPAVVIFEEIFGPENSAFRNAVVQAVANLSLWRELVLEKASYAADPSKRLGVSRWILGEYFKRLPKIEKPLPSVQEKAAEDDANRAAIKGPPPRTQPKMLTAGTERSAAVV